MNYVFEPLQAPTLPIHGSDKLFPVRRIYCVGRNYAEHALEMGADPVREAPFFFGKPATAVLSNSDEIPYPPKTKSFHHEVELVVAIAKEANNIATENACSCILGYAVGNDLTRRDLQDEAKKARRPWDVAKGFDCSAPISPLMPVEQCGFLDKGEISLKVNGEIRQQGDLKDMIWSVSEIIAVLSTLFILKPGDLIFTGTPSGVGPLQVGDTVECFIQGVATTQHKIV
jgi:fumarylpyruvate hydrolase